MRTFISCIAILILQLSDVSGQTRIFIDGPNRVDTTRMPLIFVDSFRTDLKHCIIDPGNIQSINIFKDSSSVKFGDAGKYDVIMICSKPNTKFLRVDDILTEYKLPDEDKKLKICINKTFMPNRQLIIIDRSEIERVEITTDRYWINSEDANSGERFINIVTRSKGGSGL